MNVLIENKHITEMECGTNFSYILDDSASFLSTEYKVLQSQTNSCFVKCMKMLYNGKIQIYYLTNTLRPLSMMIPSLDAASFLIIAANLFDNIIKVKHNGFLSCQNIDISFERIYVDPATYKVSLVYLPLSKRIYGDDSAFENDIRTGLVRLISSVSTLSSPKTMQLCMDLSDGTLTMQDLYNRIKGVKIPDHDPAINPANPGTLRLVAMNAPMRVEIPVTKDNFVIGKKQESVDGVVSFNPKISRTHCQINVRGGQYSVMDLQSANGTYVNGIRLQPNKPHPIKHGDVIRMANSDFQVTK